MTDTPAPNTLRDIALEWLMRVQLAPQDAALQAALAHWLEAAPEHVTAYRSAQRIWQLSGQLAPTTQAHWPRPKPAPGNVTPLRRRRRWPQVVAAGLAACLIIALAPSLWLRLHADYRTDFAQQQRVTLPDGSVVQLDGDSAIAVTLGAQRREVHLLRGQAFFEVAPDGSRPFHVLAGSLDIRVTGTAFNVERRAHGEAVSVDHGSVQVRDTRSTDLPSASLTAGQRLTFDDRSGHSSLTQLPVSQVAAWRKYQLIANNERLGDVIQTLQHYMTGKIVLRDDDLAEQRITGLYNLDQPALALRAMIEPHGGNLTTYSDYVWVITR